MCLDYPTRSNYRPKEASSSLVPVRGPESHSLLLCLNASTFAYWCGGAVCVCGGGVPGIPNTSHLTTKPPCEGLTQQDLEMDPGSASCLLLRILTPWIMSQTEGSAEQLLKGHCICFPLFAFHTFPALGVGAGGGDPAFGFGFKRAGFWAPGSIEEGKSTGREQVHRILCNLCVKLCQQDAENRSVEEIPQLNDETLRVPERRGLDGICFDLRTYLQESLEGV